jgi:Cu+-exporting ATPase
MQKTFFFLLSVLWLAAAGCAAKHPADARPVAVCQVCSCNRDMGCLRVRVDENTPKAEYESKNYYFCSDKCRDNFLKDPEKYLKKKREKKN